MPREIVVNGRFLTRRVTGVERYGREVLRFIGGNCRVEKPRRPLNGMLGHAWEQVILASRINSRSILWSPANTGPLMVSEQALSIHDLSPLEHPEWFRASFSAWYRLFQPLLAKRVRRILTVSETVKQKLVARFGVKEVTVIPGGVDMAQFHPAARGRDFGLPARYILFVGSLEPRKNLPLLLQAWDALKDDFADAALVVAGSSGRVFRPVGWSRSSERVRWLGYVADEDLPALYAGATLFVLPSLDEGFGLPVLEAMACGTPVIASNGGALPEVVGEAGMIFNLSEPNGLENMLRMCLDDEQLRMTLSDKGFERASAFTWQRTADLVWRALNEL